MKFLKYMMAFLLCMACVFQVNINRCFASTAAGKKNIVILEWSGDYPVKHLDKLPEGQRASSVGYINDTKTFAAVWQTFKPGEKLPEVDFSANLIIFVRNVNFYNKISVLKCTLNEGVAELLTMETMSANPIEDKVAMALAVVPRAGLKFIRAGDENIPVTDNVKSPQSGAKSPDQACYMIEKQEICLVNGQHEVAAAPGSATNIKTAIFGRPVYGDLDANGNKDAAMFLVQDKGGSGVFYYAAAALNMDGIFAGTHAIFLGDRIAPQNIEIRDGVIIVSYAERKAGEPMATPPSMGVSKYLVVKENLLMETTPSIFRK